MEEMERRGVELRIQGRIASEDEARACWEARYGNANGFQVAIETAVLMARSFGIRSLVNAALGMEISPCRKKSNA